MHRRATLATIAGLAFFYSLGLAADNAPFLTERLGTGSDWDLSLSTYTYLSQHARDYTNPNVVADRDWLHLEARYNYEALKTGSVWIGYNFNTGQKLKFAVTPMLGGVFGDITGVAPGYSISVQYKKVDLVSQAEYFFDAGSGSGNFFYSWSELSAHPTDRFRIGGVVERTQTSGSNSEVRRGPLIGFRYKGMDLTTYWLKPGSREAEFVFAVTVRL